MRGTVTFGITVKVIIIVTLQVVGWVNQVAFSSEIKCVRYETNKPGGGPSQGAGSSLWREGLNPERDGVNCRWAYTGLVDERDGGNWEGFYS